eukprot:gene6334-1130_t
MRAGVSGPLPDLAQSQVNIPPSPHPHPGPSLTGPPSRAKTGPFPEPLCTSPAAPPLPKGCVPAWGHGCGGRCLPPGYGRGAGAGHISSVVHLPRTGGAPSPLAVLICRKMPAAAMHCAT